MHRAGTWTLCLLAGLSLLWSHPAWAEVAVPPLPASGVADTAGVLTPGELRWLSYSRENYERQSGLKLAVLTVEDAGRESPQALAARARQQWQLGPSSVVLVLVLRPHAFFVDASRDVKRLRAPEEILALQAVAAPYLNRQDPAGALHASLEAVAVRGASSGFAWAAPSGSLLLVVGSIALAVYLWFALMRRLFRLSGRPSLRASRCEKCGGQMRAHEEVVVPASRNVPGRGVRVHACPACRHSRWEPYEIPGGPFPLRPRGLAR